MFCVVDFLIEVVESGINFFEGVVVAIRVVIWRGRDCESSKMADRVLAI